MHLVKFLSQQQPCRPCVRTPISWRSCDRARRRIVRHLAEARLPAGKSLDAFDFVAVPMISKRTTDLVRLQVARRELALENAIAKLDKYHLLILDDIAYVSKDQAETSVLFELIGSRYERRSMLIAASANGARSSPIRP